MRWRTGDDSIPFFVRDPDQSPGLQAQAVHEATRALAADPDAHKGDLRATQAGPRWPWFLAWLLLTTAGWWFERTRLGLASGGAREQRSKLRSTHHIDLESIACHRLNPDRAGVCAKIAAFRPRSSAG